MNDTVLITGGSKGIGKACAKIFSARGYNVIITGRNEEKLKSVAEQTDNCACLVWDISDVANADLYIKQAHKLFGNINIFINNAGIVSDEQWNGTAFPNNSIEAWNLTMDINLKGTYFACQAESKYMIDRGINGHIVNVCSEMGFRCASDPYGISKWGIRGMTQGMAKSLSQYGIVVNGIAPGETATEILRQKEGEPFLNASLRGERAMPEEIAEDIYYLSQSKNIIGAILNSDGGRSVY